MEKVLLPLALDYHIRSRDIEVNAVAAEELNNLNGDANAKSGAVQVRQWKTWLQIKHRTATLISVPLFLFPMVFTTFYFLSLCNYYFIQSVTILDWIGVVFSIKVVFFRHPTLGCFHSIANLPNNWRCPSAVFDCDALQTFSFQLWDIFIFFIFLHVYDVFVPI